MASQNSEAVRVRPPVLHQEKSYSHWRSAILTWSLITDVEPEKQALVVALHLRGRARELALNIDSVELNKKTGLTTLLNLLDEQIQGLDAYKTFQKLDNHRKSPLQSMCDYVDSFEILYESAKALGSSIPDKILAYKLLNGSGLSQERQEKIVETTEIITVAGISATLLSAGNWPRTKVFPETTANVSKQLQAICIQPNQSQQLHTQTSLLSNTSSKFSFSASNDQTIVAGANSTVKVTEMAALASTKDSSKNVFPGFSFSDTSLKNSSNGKQEVNFSSNPFSSLKSSLEKTNEEMLMKTRTKGRAKATTTATPIVPSFGAATTPAKASTPQAVQGRSKEYTTEGMLVTSKEAGSWNCPTCYSPNLATDLQCTCCCTPNPSEPKIGADASVSHPAVTTATATSTTAQTSESSTFGFNAAAGYSFADLVQSNTSDFGSSTANSGGWIGLTEQKPLFANFSQHETSQDGKEQYRNDEADNIHFEPVIKLPDKVETVTGEEDEETLYTQRCKLYRFNKLTNEWKERGVGDIKFLKHHKTGKIRIVMRREQVLKVCANHYIRPGMTLDANKTSDRAWSWTAMDFTDEGEPKLEVFTARFKSVEITNEFKKKFDMCQTMLLDADPTTPCKASSMRSQELTEKAEKMKNEIRFFKEKFSQPSKVDLDNTITDVSSATHDDDDVVFICELVPTDDQKKRAEKLLLPATFFLHENNPLPPGFDEKIEDDKEDKILKFIEDRESGKLKLNEKTTTTATTKTTTAESSGFGDTIKTNTTKLADSSSNEEGWVFGDATQSAATFSSVGAASFGSLSSGVQNVGFRKDPSFQFPGAGKVMFASQTTEGDDHHDPASFKCEAQFKPVLEELPPLIEVKTGEEGEEIVFKERCKLYRYDKDVKAWKEKGVGEIKILRNDEYKLYRVVMRRDQVLKVCTNHVINETTNPEPHLGSTKSCSYFVMDYSESKIPIPEKIAIRFKLDELCKTYMDKIAEIKHLQEPQS